MWTTHSKRIAFYVIVEDENEETQIASEQTGSVNASEAFRMRHSVRTRVAIAISEIEDAADG